MDEQGIRIRQFNAASDDLHQEWKDWFEEFEVFIELKEIKTQRSKYLYLQNKGGSDLIRLIKTLPVGEDEQTTEQAIAIAAEAGIDGADIEDPIYDNALKRLNNHFGLKKNLVLAQHKFRQLRQEPKEKFGKFMARMYKQASNCDWNETETKNQIVQQIATGAKDVNVRRKAVIGGLTFLKLEQWANAQESAEEQLGWLQAETKRPETEIPGTSESVAQVYGRGFRGREQKRPGPYSKVIHDCRNCGKDHHFGKCTATGKECKYCHKVGHFELKCYSKKSQNFRQNRGSEKSNKRVDLVTMEPDDEHEFPDVDNKPEVYFK